MGLRWIVLMALAIVALADAAEAEPLVARPSRRIGDGRSVVPIQFAGGPPPRDGELADDPELPLVQCEAGQTVSSNAPRVAYVLAPARARGETIQCAATLRGEKTSFELTVTKPGPGIYLLAPPRVVARSGSVVLRPFVVYEGGAVAKPTDLRAVASSGTVKITEDGLVELLLGESKAPRMVSVVVTDGTQAGTVYVVVVGSSNLPVRAQRRATVEVRVGGSWTEPVKTRRGRAKVPIMVLPGADHAVLRSTVRGYAVESRIGLPQANFPRIVAIPVAEELEAGETRDIVIAYSGPTGRPGGPKSQFTAQADRGKLLPAKSAGPGMWRIPYTAPGSPGTDNIRIQALGDEVAGTAEVVIKVVAGPTVLRAEPSERGMGIGAWAGGGFSTNTHGLSGPRITAGALVVRQFGRIEMGLMVGAEWLQADRGVDSMAGGAPSVIDQRVRIMGVPVRVRGRLGLWKRLGGWASAEVIPSVADIEISPDFQTPDRYRKFALGVRGGLGADFVIGDGRISAGATLGHAALSEPAVAGTLERVSVMIGYEMRLWATGI